MVKAQSRGDRAFDIVNHVLLVLVMLIALYPLYFVLIASVSDQDLVNAGRVFLWPQGFTLAGFRRILDSADIWTGYANTIFYTVFGTAISVTLTALIAYPLSRKDFRLRGLLTAFLIVVMVFPAGLIPRYLIVSNLRMLNTRWALLIPSCVWVYNVIIARTFYQNTIPGELLDAASIDGCTDWGFFIRIATPLSLPVLVVLALYYGVDKWNSYFEAMIYISKSHLQPLQIILKNILIQSQTEMQMLSDIESLGDRLKLADSIKYCVIIISTVPMLMVYAFFQRYLVKGVMIGAIKG